MPIVAGVAGLVLVVVGAVVTVRIVASEPAGSVDTATSRLPALIEPIEGAAELPAQHAVGPGALIYAACGDCGPVLVLADGAHFTLPGERSGALFSHSLSPDGRWLASVDTTGVTVRDLTGGRTHAVAHPDAADGLALWAWSADSRWLLLAEGGFDVSFGIRSTAALLDLTDGTSTRVSASSGRIPTAVLSSGQLLAIEDPLGFGDVAGRLTWIEMEVLDPRSGTTEGVTIDAGDWLESSETLVQEGEINGVQLVAAPSGDGIYLSVFGDATGPVALLEVDLSGRILSRLEIATEMPERRIWWIAGQMDGRMVVAMAQFIPDSLERSFTLYAVSGEGLRELTVLEPALLVRLAGTAAQGGAPY